MSSGRAIGILTSLNLVGAGIGVVQTIVLAYFFGTSRTLEIYFAAVAVQASLVGLAQLGQLSEIFLPQYHQLRHRYGRQQAFAAFSVVINWTVLLAIGVSLSFWFLAPQLMYLRVPGFSPEDIDLATSVFRFILPLLPVQFAIALLGMLANAEKWFGRPEAVQVGGRLIGLVCIASLSAAGWGIWGLVTALIVNTVSAVIGLAVILVRLGYRHQFRLRHDNFRPMQVVRQLGATSTYVGATQVFGFAFDAALSTLPQGTFAVFKYVNGLSSKGLASLMRPVSIVFFTHFSTAFTQGAANVRDLAQVALARSLAIAVALFVVAATAARPLLGALWGPEQFGVEELRLAAVLLTLLCAIAFLSGFSLIGRKIGATLGMVRSMYIAGACSQLAAAAISWFVITRFGTDGALVTVILVNVMLQLSLPLPIVIWRREWLVWYDWGLFARWAVAAAIACAVGTLALDHVPLHWETSRLTSLVAGAAVASCSLSALLVAAYVLRINEVCDVVRRLRRVLSPGPGAS